jgi:ribosomal protein S18 acetylase RimI-like enzyme
MFIRTYQPEDEAAVVDLWKRCGLTRPWNDPHKDIRRKLRVRPDWFLVGVVREEIVATAMVGYDGHRGWVYYLGVAPEHRHKGYGRFLMERAESLLREENCAKINLQVRSENEEAIEFYRRLGFAMDEVLSMGKRLEPD